jgi:hypothetical protein
VAAFPGTLANVRYVYVACYDGDQFNPNLLSEDRNAIGDVQNAIQKWGKLRSCIAVPVPPQLLQSRTFVPTRASGNPMLSQRRLRLVSVIMIAHQLRDGFSFCFDQGAQNGHPSRLGETPVVGPTSSCLDKEFLIFFRKPELFLQHCCKQVN